MESLWPAEVPTATITTPLSILREQAAILGKITKNILEGEIISATDEAPSSDEFETIIASMVKSSVERQASQQSDPVFYHSFFIKVPSLNNYRYKLFYVRHTITLYPLSIGVNQMKIDCVDEIEFKTRLGEVLSAPETTRILATLINQSGG